MSPETASAMVVAAGLGALVGFLFGSGLVLTAWERTEQEEESGLAALRRLLDEDDDV